MAFASPAPLARGRSVRSSPTTRASAPRRGHVRATAAQPRRTKAVPASSRTPAPTIDTRVASRSEVHHWVAVSRNSLRLFERAAVAQVDVTRDLDARTTDGALHRWVLRHIDTSAPAGAPARYVVMESFARDAVAHHDGTPHSPTRRWLSAVERVRPIVNAIDINSLVYHNFYTCKRHDAQFDPRNNVVVVEALNLPSTESRQDAMTEALTRAAERAVASSHCLEFCVLQSIADPAFFKTIEVYRDQSGLDEHMATVDPTFVEAVSPNLTGVKRNRNLFQPVVFA